jgi:hypothetical protein
MSRLPTSNLVTRYVVTLRDMATGNVFTWFSDYCKDQDIGRRPSRRGLREQGQDQAGALLTASR